jgi:hypothetical protein
LVGVAPGVITLGSAASYQPITGFKATTNMGGNAVNRPCAADDFAIIRARMEKLRREREGTKPSDKDAQREPPVLRRNAIRWPPSETSAGLGRVRQSGMTT